MICMFSQKECNEERWHEHNPLLVKGYTKFGSILELYYNIHSHASSNLDKLNNVTPLIIQTFIVSKSIL